VDSQHAVLRDRGEEFDVLSIQLEAHWGLLPSSVITDGQALPHGNMRGKPTADSRIRRRRGATDDRERRAGRGDIEGQPMAAARAADWPPGRRSIRDGNSNPPGSPGSRGHGLTRANRIQRTATGGRSGERVAWGERRVYRAMDRGRVEYKVTMRGARGTLQVLGVRPGRASSGLYNRRYRCHAQ